VTGVVTRILHLRGYWFIKDSNGDERFLHAGDLVDQSLWPNLKNGQRVEFEPRARPKGSRNGLGTARVRLVA
jgi:cold shock CspA family protein